jgi:hypothetical protein
VECAVEDMTAWLRMMMPPFDPAESDPEVYRHGGDDELECGSRVADDLLSEWAWGNSPAGLAVVLEQRVARAADRARQDDAQPVATDTLPPQRTGTVIWSVPAYAPYVLPISTLRYLTEWMRFNDVEYASGVHEVRVEICDDGSRTIAYHRGQPPLRHRPPDPTVTPVRVLLRTEPPSVPELPDLAALGAVIDAHPVGAAHFNLALPIGSQVCTACTTVEHPVVYPCPPLVAAAFATGVTIYADDDEPDYDGLNDDEQNTA